MKFKHKVNNHKNKVGIDFGGYSSNNLQIFSRFTSGKIIFTAQNVVCFYVYNLVKNCLIYNWFW